MGVEDRWDASPSGDAALLAEIGAGRADSFQSFYGRHAGRVLAYARKLCGERGVAEDVVQDVFLAVWRKAASYREDRGDVAGWLYSITRNRVLDRWRREGRGPIAVDLDLSRFETPAPKVERETRLALVRALDGLRDEHRIPLRLAYFGGLTYEETAVRLNLPVGTLKSRIRAALAQMRQALE